MVALGASLSAFWIMVANSWMQTPAGGHWEAGRYVSTSFWGSLFNPDMPWGVSHMWVACLESTLFIVGGISAWYILKKRHVDFFTKSFKVALMAAILMAPLQVWLGDGSGRSVAHTQPTKLAAMEAHWQTNPPGQGAPWKLLAWPNPAKQDNDWTFLTIPDGLSLLITRTFTGQVKGLRDFPPEDQPPIVLPFYTFRIMLGVGFGLFGLMLWTLWGWRRGWLTPENIGRNKWLLSAWVAAIPAGMVAIEAGWVTREVGRQPWVIYGLLRTSDRGHRPCPRPRWAPPCSSMASSISSCSPPSWSSPGASSSGGRTSPGRCPSRARRRRREGRGHGTDPPGPLVRPDRLHALPGRGLGRF